MVLKVYSSVDTKTLVEGRVGFVSPRSPKGYVSNNAYSHNRVTGGSIYATAQRPFPRMNASIPTSAFNKLNARIVDSVTGPKAELLTAAVEWRTSLDMITQRARQLGHAYLALRRLEFGRVASLLSMSPRDAAIARKRASRKTSASEMWLEYWMGWAPTWGDIANALSALERDFPAQKLKASTRFTKEPYYDKFVAGNERLTTVGDCEGRISAYGSVKITNYNLLLASQLGLTNPVLTGFQLIPFSFILNWFVNAEQMLGALNPHAGVSVSTAGYGYAVRSTVRAEGQVWLWDPYLGTKIKLITVNEVQNGRYVGRVPGSIPTPQLQVKFDTPSLTRAATSISLLVEIFLRKK